MHVSEKSKPTKPSTPSRAKRFSSRKKLRRTDGFQLIHALVDSLYVWKEGATHEDFERLAREIEEQNTAFPLAIESVYRYVVFLPSKQYAGCARTESLLCRWRRRRSQEFAASNADAMTRLRC